MMISRIKRIFKSNHPRESITNDDTAYDELYRQFNLIIHIGAPKSGTSALQHFFMKNRSLLLKYGLYYPKHGLDKNGISAGHSKLPVALMGSKKEEAELLFNSWYTEAQHKNATLLLSSEVFFDTSKLMAPFLADKRVLVIAYHRNIPDFIISVHNQIIKRSYGTATLKCFVKSLIDGSDEATHLLKKSFTNVYKDWESVIGKPSLIVRSYENSRSIEKDFLQRIGIDPALFHYHEKMVNISYTPDALEAKRLVNHVLSIKDKDLNRRIDLRLQEYSEKQKLSFYDLKTPFDTNAVSALLQSFMSDEVNVRNTYVENLSNISKEFSSVSQILKTDPLHRKQLKSVFDFLLKDRKAYAALLQLTMRKLESGLMDYGGYQLAEILAIEDLETCELQSAWFTQTQLNHMFEGRFQEADYLREIARLLIARKDFDNADRIISRALELRPNGPAIQQIKKRVVERKSAELSPKES